VTVAKIIKSFKKNKSPGVDEITSTYALKICEIIAGPLSSIFNRSFQHNEIPSDWKKGNVIPIFKKGSKKLVENYRPVSLTCFFGKTMEKIIKNYLETFLIDKNYIKASQHGFSKGKSCTTNLIIYQDSVLGMLDEDSSVDVIYFDLQKAFDKVPHDILIKKIIETGVEIDIVNWIENWLTDRQQRVVVDGECSDWAIVDSGVPQGSILGPLLFSIFINDIDNNLKNTILKFADDTKLWGKVDSDEERNLMQKDIDTLEFWSKMNKMPFNVPKCKVLHLGKNNAQRNYTLMGISLSNTDEEKDLGVVFDNKFTPSINCKKVCKACQIVIGLIKRNIKNRSKEGMLILYKTLVRPLLDYCSQVWRPYLKKDINSLEKIQKRYTKMVEGCKNLKYEQRLKRLNLTTIEERQRRLDMVLTYKIINDRSNIYPKDFLKLSDRLGRKNSKKLFKIRVNKELKKNGFTFRIIDQWNELPDRVVMAENVNMFKGEYDRLMREVGRQS
jgi:ribonuclease P/MRP protein subunit RPP40